MKIQALCGLVLLLLCGEKQQKETNSVAKETEKESMRKLEKFEPIDGKVLLFIGQELAAVGGLDEYSDGYLDHFEARLAGLPIPISTLGRTLLAEFKKGWTVFSKATIGVIMTMHNNN